MATALEVLSLTRLKAELEIPETAHEHDNLLLDHIAASVSFARAASGYPVADTAAVDIDPLFTMATIMVARALYDGLLNWNRQAAIYHLLAPLTRLVVQED